MKFILSAILLLVAYIGYAECQATVSPAIAQRREALLRRANYLINLVSGEIKLLQIEDHLLVRQGLEQELRSLVETELELRATAVENVTEAFVVRLETQLNGIEQRINTELTRLGRQFVSRTEIDNFLRRTQELLSLISDSVRRLRAANRTVLALGLESEEVTIVQLEVEIRATQNSAQLRRLEETLIQAEYRVYELIQQVEAGGVRRKRDLKADVLARATELIALANAAVRQLRARNRANAATVIVNIERRIQDVANDLNMTTDAAVIARLDGELIGLENQLVADLRMVGQPVDLNEYRRVLQTNAEGLQAWATTEIAALTAANNTAEIRVIQNELRAVTQILTELANATNRNQLRDIESRMIESEYRLMEELLRLSRPEAYRRRLIRDAEDLAVLVTVEIRNLRNSNRTLAAEGLVAEETQLVMLDVELRDAATVAEIQNLERRLQAIEERVFAQLVALGLRVAGRKRTLQDDLIARATELINITNAAIAEFRAANRTNAVRLLNTTEMQLQAMVTELKAATNESAVQGLEVRVLRTELELAEDLRRLGRPIDVNERRDLLITRAEALQRYAAAQIAAARNRSLEVTRIQNQEQTIANIIGNLKNATLHSDLTRLEDLLNNAENVLLDELRALGQPVVPRNTIVALQQRAEDLAVQLIVEIRTLRQQGRTLLAEGLAVEEQRLVDLYVELQVALTPERIVTVERRLQEAETRVAAELARIAGTFF